MPVQARCCMRTASFRGPPQQGRAESPGSVVWFISFGDLLTLLLCFFLVLTPWDHLSGMVGGEKIQGVGGKLQPIQEAGTSLAEQSARKEPELLAEIPLHAELAASQDGVAEARLLAALEDALLEHRGASGLSLRVTVCAPHGAPAEALARVLPLVGARQFSHLPLEVEMGAGCRGSEGIGSSEPVAVGSVKISRM